MRVLVSNRCEFTIRDLFKECVQGLKNFFFPMEKRVSGRTFLVVGPFFKKASERPFLSTQATQRAAGGFLLLDQKNRSPFISSFDF